MAEETLVFGNVTTTDFYNALFLCQDAAWLSQYSEPHTKSYDLVIKYFEFYSTVENASLAISEFADFVGTTESRVDAVYNYYGGGEAFAAMVAQAKDIIPLFGHPAQNSGLYVGIFTLLSILAVATLGLRIYSRLTINGYIRSYDWILITASIVTFAFGLMNAITLSGPFHYRGQWDRSYNGYDIGNSAGIASDVLYPVTILLIKASLLLFYWKLTPYWPLRLSVVAVGVIILANSFAMIFIWVFKCNPVLYWKDDAYWNSECKTALWQKSEVVCGGINIATDVAVWVLPLPMIWKIRQSLRERLLTCATFGVGALACIACGIRLHTIQNLNVGDLIPSDQTPYLLWTMTELYLAIICSSVPALRALLIKKVPSVLRVSDTNSIPEEKESSLRDEKKDVGMSVKPASPV